MDHEQLINGIRQSFREAATWRKYTTRVSSDDATVWSDELCNRAQLRGSYSGAPQVDYSVARDNDATKRAGIVRAVVTTRSNLLSSRNVRLGTLQDAREAGRLVVYWPSRTISDGLAEEASGGLFDRNGCPGWDTWVWHIDLRTVNSPSQSELRLTSQANDYIVALVPKSHLPRAERAIDVDPMMTIEWLDELDEASAPGVNTIRVALVDNHARA